MNKDSPILFQYHWSKYLKNWLAYPLLWLGSVHLGCWLLSVEFSWRILFVVVIGNFFIDVAEATFDDRPIYGPTRWKRGAKP